MSNRARLVLALILCLIGLIAANAVCCASGMTTLGMAVDRSVFQCVAFISFFVAEYTQPILFERKD